MTYATPLFKDYADKYLESHVRSLPEEKQARYRSAMAHKTAASGYDLPRGMVAKPRPQVRILVALGLLTLALAAFLFFKPTHFLGEKNQQATLESQSEPIGNSGQEESLPQPETEVPDPLTGTNSPDMSTGDTPKDLDIRKARPKVKLLPTPNVHGNPRLAETYAPFGLPGATHIFLRSGYAMGFSDQSGIAKWVAYKTQIGAYSPITGYAADRELERAGVAQLEHTAKREGYVRGAFIPASHLSGLPDQESLHYYSIRTLMAKETNSYLNQTSPGVDRGVSNTYVITGSIDAAKSQGLYLAEAFFRISYRNAGGYPDLVQGYIVPNRPGISKRADYRVTIDAIEKATGLDFFSELGDQTFESVL